GAAARSCRLIESSVPVGAPTWPPHSPSARRVPAEPGRSSSFGWAEKGTAVPVPKDATDVTRALNRAVREALPFEDRQDFDDAQRGFVGTLPDVEVTNAS